MSLGVRGDEFSILTCDDPHGRDCKEQTPPLGFHKDPKKLVETLGWLNNAKTGQLLCPECKIIPANS